MKNIFSQEKTIFKYKLKKKHIILLIFLLSPLLNLWLIDSWFKYVFLVIEYLSIIIFFLIINRKIDFQLKIPRNINIYSSLKFALIYLLLIFLLIINVFEINGNIFTSFFSLIATSLVPGYFIINLVVDKNIFSRLEEFILSFVLSYIFTASICLFLSILHISFKSEILLISYIGLCLLYQFKRKKKPLNHYNIKSFCRNIDILGFLALFLIFFFPFLMVSNTIYS